MITKITISQELRQLIRDGGYGLDGELIDDGLNGQGWIAVSRKLTEAVDSNAPRRAQNGHWIVSVSRKHLSIMNGMGLIYKLGQLTNQDVEIKSSVLNCFLHVPTDRREEIVDPELFPNCQVDAEAKPLAWSSPGYEYFADHTELAKLLKTEGREEFVDGRTLIAIELAGFAIVDSSVVVDLVAKSQANNEEL